MKQLNHLEKDDVDQVKRKDHKTTIVIANGEKYTINGDECSCGHTRDYTPSMGTPLKQSYINRRKASCKHQIAVLNAKDLGPCPNCDNYEVKEHKKYHEGKHVMSTYTCTNCGTKIPEK